MNKKFNINKQRMQGGGAGVAARNKLGFQPNLLHGLKDLCEKFILADFRVLEIGCFDGVSTELFCVYAKEVIGVDLYTRANLKKVIKNNKNLEFHQKSAKQYINTNPKKFDLIYIDGDHSYEAAKSDILDSLKVLKKGGILCGHDMNDVCPGVSKAVYEIFPKITNESMILHRFSDSSWAVKPE